MNSEKSYYVYNVLAAHFESSKWRIKKIPTFKENFAKFYLKNNNKKEREIIEKLFSNLVCKEENIVDINQYIYDTVCNNNSAQCANLAYKLQLTFILLYAIKKIFKIPDKDNDLFFRLIKFYLKLGAIIIWKNNREDKTCTLAIIKLHQATSPTCCTALTEGDVYKYSCYNSVTLKIKQTDNNFNYYTSNKILIPEFDSKYSTVEDIQKNSKILYSFFIENIDSASKKYCLWCNPTKSLDGKNKKCERCKAINEELIELNNLCGKDYRPFKDKHNISEKIINYRRRGESLWASIEKTLDNILIKYEKNLNKIENPEEKEKIKFLLAREKETKAIWQKLKELYNLSVKKDSVNYFLIHGYNLKK